MARALIPVDAAPSVEPKRVRLWDDGHVVMEHVTGVVPADRLVVTFAHYGSNAVAAPGYAEGVLRARGFDVLAVKTARNDWFQTVSLEQMAEIRAQLPDYAQVATLGSDMGGYAALYFVDALRAQMAIALSPQFSIDPSVVPDEQRWAHEAARITFKHQPMSKVPHNPDTRRFVIFDPYNQDRVHISALRAAGIRIEPVPVLYGGHPVGAMLEEIGVLDATILALLDRRPPNVRDAVRTGRDRSAIYCYTIATRAMARHRPAATALMERATKLSERSDILLTHSRLCYDLGRWADALALLDRIPSAGSDPHLVSYRGHLLEMLGRPDEALACFAVAIDRQPDFAAFYVNERRVVQGRLHTLQMQNTMVTARLSKMEAEEALRVGPKMPTLEPKHYVMLATVPIIVALAIFLLARSFNLL